MPPTTEIPDLESIGVVQEGETEFRTLSPQGLALYDQLIAQHEQVAQQKQAELAQLYTLIETMKRLRAGAQDGT